MNIMKPVIHKLILLAAISCTGVTAMAQETGEEKKALKKLNIQSGNSRSTTKEETALPVMPGTVIIGEPEKKTQEPVAPLVELNKNESQAGIANQSEVPGRGLPPGSTTAKP